VTASAARRFAREVVTKVRERSGFAHDVLDSAMRSSELGPADRGLATRLVYGSIQTQGTLDDAIDRNLTSGRIEPRVRDALRVAAYELLYLRTPSRAAVNEGVELVREVRPQASGLANAVLRRLAAEVPSFPWGDPSLDDVALARQFAHPLWIAELWVAELGRAAAAAVMAANNEPPPLFVAENPFAGDSGRVLEVLRSDGAEPEPCLFAGCYRLTNAASAVHGSALREGLVVASDEAAQTVVRLACVQPGQRVLEIGSGRGTKTLLTQAAAVARGGPAQISAVDLHAFKAKLLRQRLDEFGVPGVTALVGDATELDAVPGLASGPTFDVALIDAPCSGLGTLRRHPDQRWRVKPDDVESLALLGSELLRQAARRVRSGGLVIYSTCTITNRENAQVVRSFLASEEGRDFRADELLADVPAQWERFITGEGFFQSLPESEGPDGHFAARLRRI
jgi:16S rRNA (cytosine967-C5)-methyltransferase